MATKFIAAAVKDTRKATRKAVAKTIVSASRRAKDAAAFHAFLEEFKLLADTVTNGAALNRRVSGSDSHDEMDQLSALVRIVDDAGDYRIAGGN